MKEILFLIKKIIKNDDIANHIYNHYLINLYFDNGNLNLMNEKLFSNYFKKDNYYTNLIIDKINFRNPSNLIFIKRMFKDNDEIFFKIIKKYPFLIKNLDYKYKNNKILIKEICSHKSYYFKYASNELKHNLNFIKSLIDINIYIYFFIDDIFKDNLDIITKIININPFILELILFNQPHLQMVLQKVLQNQLD